MTAVSQRIPNLLGGVSQQPDSLKLPGQVSTAKNCVPDPTYGMLKRAGLKLVSALTGATDEGRWFSIFRDQTERYIGQFTTAGDLRVWDANTGAAKTVNTVAATAKAYIANCTQSDFEMLQINDYNFVLNRSKVVGKLATKSPPQAPTGIATVNLLGYDAKYKLTVDTFTAEHKTPALGTLDLASVVSDLATEVAALDGGGKYTAEICGNTLLIRRVDGAEFTITGEGGINAQSLLVYKDSVPNVSRLPTSCKNDTVLKVSNLDEAEGDDYYVKFVVKQGGTTIGTGIWEETIAPFIETHIDPDTMPHVIIRETDGTFTFRSLNEAQKAGDELYWVERQVGDDETNPFPSVVGKKVTGLSFFRNRLVILAGSNVICSQPSSYFNLFKVSALATTDADGIDLASGSTRPVDLRYALGDQLGLVLFSATSQFMLTSETDNFGPVSAALKKFSSYDINPTVAPVETGISYVFVDKNQSSSRVTEMVATSAENRPTIADLSRTAPNFVPASLSTISVSSSAGHISFLCTCKKKNLRVFRFFNNGNERVLASWVEWTLPGECLHQSIDQDLKFLVTKQANGICLSTVSLISDIEGTAINSSGLPYEYRIDLFDAAPVLEYDAANDVTKVFFKDGVYDPDLETLVVVDDNASEKGSIYLSPPSANVGAGWYVAIPGDRTGADNVVIGYTYEYRLDMPVFYRKNNTQGGQVQADVINIPRVTKMVIQSSDSGPFNASVTVLGRPTKVYSFEQAQANAYKANSTPLPFIIDNSIPIYGKGTDSKVSIYSTTPFPLSLVAATWYGIYSNRGIQAI